MSVLYYPSHQSWHHSDFQMVPTTSPLLPSLEKNLLFDTCWWCWCPRNKARIALFAVDAFTRMSPFSWRYQWQNWALTCINLGTIQTYIRKSSMSVGCRFDSYTALLDAYIISTSFIVKELCFDWLSMDWIEYETGPETLLLLLLPSSTSVADVVVVDDVLMMLEWRCDTKQKQNQNNKKGTTNTHTDTDTPPFQHHQNIVNNNNISNRCWGW